MNLDNYREQYRQHKVAQTRLAVSVLRAVQAGTLVKPEACEHCGKVGEVVYDHDHTTGEFRAWLCRSCNRRDVLG
jgi:hypothetical protein